jgi:hypothetical protein
MHIPQVFTGKIRMKFYLVPHFLSINTDSLIKYMWQTNLNKLECSELNYFFSSQFLKGLYFRRLSAAEADGCQVSRPLCGLQ